MFQFLPILKTLLLPALAFLLAVILLPAFIEWIKYSFYKDEAEDMGVTYKSKTVSTPEARKLYGELIKLGYNAELEKWDGYKHIDIAVVRAKINIEIDGSHHNHRASTALKDLQRTFYSLEKGYVTVRISNSLIKYKFVETVGYLDKILKVRIAANEVGKNNFKIYDSTPIKK